MAGNMNTEIKTTSPGMRQSAQTIEQSHQQFVKLRQRVEDQIQTLTSGDWTGDASQRFRQACKPFFDDVDKILHSLETMRHHLFEGGKAVDKTEDEAGRASTKMQSGVGLPGMGDASN